ncbi:uncharacterized protein FMAN_04951 [Fusarium mangiferae]|uniref:Uncharacterized protein n=1 Tax=Fusarium mangiferae TaxID=192010 RepID=A0A1L7SRN7_FUSMA|nr:uncharacterized protein FMAN_04951 [Fusarium mangiferae]CVK88369.1 uncharacterized protein FMAN_04951 [Fusarium mangiferae]
MRSTWLHQQRILARVSEVTSFLSEPSLRPSPFYKQTDYLGSSCSHHFSRLAANFGGPQLIIQHLSFYTRNKEVTTSHCTLTITQKLTNRCPRRRTTPIIT